MKCFVCGNDFEQNQGKGRKKEYCSTTCREYQKYFNAMVDKLSKIKPTEEAKRMIKGEIFQIANEIKIKRSS